MLCTWGKAELILLNLILRAKGERKQTLVHMVTTVMAVILTPAVAVLSHSCAYIWRVCIRSQPTFVYSLSVFLEGKSNCFNLEWDQTRAYQSTHDMNSCMAQDENLAWCFSIEDIGRKKKKTCWNKTSSNLYWYRNVTINLILPTQSGNATATSLSKNLFCILSKDLSCISPFC